MEAVCQSAKLHDLFAQPAKVLLDDLTSKTIMARQELEDKTVPGSVYEPSDALLLAHASDEAINLGLVAEEDLVRVLKLDCLFCDAVTTPSSDLLGNRVLYDMWYKDRDNMQRLFGRANLKSKGEEAVAFVRPVLMGEHHSLREVAESMIRNHTPHGLGTDDKLRKHADFIDEAEPETYWCDEDRFRADYRHYMTETVELLSREDLSGLTGPTGAFPGDSLASLRKFLDSKTPRDRLTCGAIYRYADESNEVPAEPTKKLASALYLYAMAGGLLSDISTPVEWTPFMRCARRVDERAQENADVDQEEETGLESRPGTEKATSYQVKKPTRLELLDLVDLPLANVIRLRREPTFCKARTALTDFRRAKRYGTQSELDKLQELLNNCAAEEFGYIREGEAYYTRKKRDGMLVFLFEGTTGTIGLMEIESAFGKILLGIAVLGGIVFRASSKTRRTTNYIEPVDRVYYDAETGEVELKK